MAIRDKFRRAVGSHKSTNSTSTSSSSSSSTYGVDTDISALSSTESEANGPSATPPSTRPPVASGAAAMGNEASTVERKSRTRTFTWRSSKGSEEKKNSKKSKKQSFSPDPREKPFTETNLRYQEILGSYELTFGTRRTEQLWSYDGEISPCTSRQNSLDLSRY